MEGMTFQDLGISEEVLKAIEAAGYDAPTPIQAKAIPTVLEGNDVLGQAQTGTGKTAAFGIPAIDLVDTSKRELQVMILCPTRELALQVSNEIQKLSKFKDRLEVLAVYGGESIEAQIRGLKRGAHIIVGTPGRIIDHINRKTLKTDAIKLMVLDEADEMLNMGFRDDIEIILSTLPEERQTLLFSATMAGPIKALTAKYQKNPVLVTITRDLLTGPTIEQIYLDVRSSMKLEVMCRLIEINDFKLMLVFCNKKSKVDELTEALKARGINAEAIHGDLRQNQRNIVMSRFRKGDVNILVATDVAARGIDVENVDAVFNFDLPQDVEYYVHRIGRTGRAGKSGKAYSFVTGRKETDRLRDIERHTKSRLIRGTTPKLEELETIRREKMFVQLQGMIEEGKLEPYHKQVEVFQEQGFSLQDLAAAFIMYKFPIQTPVEFVEEEPRERRRERDSGERRERGERSGERRERERDRDRGKSRNGSGGKMTRLFLNLGAKDRIRPGDIVGAFSGEANIPGKDIGVIEIYDKFSFVEVPEEVANTVIQGMNSATIKGKKVSLEIAKGR